MEIFKSNKNNAEVFDYENFEPPVDEVNFEQLLDQFK